MSKCNGLPFPFSVISWRADLTLLSVINFAKVRDVCMVPDVNIPCELTLNGVAFTHQFIQVSCSPELYVSLQMFDVVFWLRFEMGFLEE